MKLAILFGYVCFAMAIAPQDVFAMSIMEGFIPRKQAVFWIVVAGPCLLMGARAIGDIARHNRERGMLLGLVAAFIFVLSACKIPSITGFSSYATGVGLGAVIFGPAVASVLSGIVLLFQGLFLANGGLTTWGANTFAMGVVGAFTAWSVFHLAQRMGAKAGAAMFLAAFSGNMATYLVTAAQLAIAFPYAVGGYGTAWLMFINIFAFTQLPLAVMEGLLSVIVYNIVMQYARKGKQNLILLTLVLVLAVVPFLMHGDSEFHSVDKQVQDVILADQPDYRPWFTLPWKPLPSEVNSLLIAFQVTVGVGFIGYFIVYHRGRKASKTR